MIPNRFAFVALCMACLVAAAGGGYLAVRQSAVSSPTASAATIPSSASASRAAQPSVPVADQPVGASEPIKARPSAAEPVSMPSAPPARSVAKREQSRPAPQPTARQVNIPPVRREEPPVSAAAPERASASTTAQTITPSPAPVVPAPSVASPVSPEPVAAAPRVDERPAHEAPRAYEPPRRTFEELVVAASSVIGLQTENRAISSETARVEDRVEARVTRDVKVGDSVAIPAGSRAVGSVTFVERGGKFKERARLGVRFETLVLPDGTRVPIRTETIYRDGEAPGNGSAAKIGGGAVGGAILGAIIGGAKGAAIGATAGAGGGAAMTAAGDRSAATLPAGTPMTVRILAPVTVTIEK